MAPSLPRILREREAPSTDFGPMNQSARNEVRKQTIGRVCVFITVAGLVVGGIVLGIVFGGRSHSDYDDGSSYLDTNSDGGSSYPNTDPNGGWSCPDTNSDGESSYPNTDSDGGSSYPNTSYWHRIVNTTSNGSEIAMDVLAVKSHNMSTHPCKDFYQYSCGGWMIDNPSSDYKSQDRFSQVRDDVHKILTGELEKGVGSRDSAAFRKAKIFYQSCMDEYKIESLKAQPVVSVLSEIGQWSLAGATIDNIAFDVVDAMIKMAAFKAYPLGIFEVITDPKNSSRTIIRMDQPNLLQAGLPNLPLRETGPIRDGYKSYIQYVAATLGQGRYLDMDDRVSSLIDLQMEITQMTTNTDGVYYIHKLGDLNSVFPYLDWKRLLTGMFSRPEVNIALNDDEPILVENSAYFKEIGNRLKWENGRTKSDYMGWVFVQGMLPFLSRNLRTAENIAYKALKRKLLDPVRSEFCTRIIDINLANMTGRMLIDKELDPVAVQMAQEMVTDIRKVFREKLQADDWMDKKTREIAINKLDAMGELIAYPPEIMNDTILDDQYGDLIFREFNFFENYLQLVKRARINSLKTLHQPTSRLRWDVGPTMVNAVYDVHKNIIVIPAGILRKPFFCKQFPRSMIYSRLGFIIGHEITHGFDNSGRKFDKNGNFVHWWTQDALNKYTCKAKCFERQYSNYYYPDLFQKLNGTRTLGENIADNGGLKHAHKAYREFVSRRGSEEDELPSLGMSHDQVFYITFAQLWCETRGEDAAKLDVKSASATHSPRKLRVLGSLQNNQHFSDTFKCRVGNTMDPSHKCLLW